MSNPMDDIVGKVKAAQDATPATAPAPAATKSMSSITPEQLQMLQDVLDLKKQLEAAKAAGKTAAPVKKEIDWAGLSEKDIYNLTIDIPVIEQEIPSYMDVHLLDKNYVVRWVHMLPQNLGMKLASGYTYVKKEEMDTSYPIYLNFDTSGNYSHGDVVCLKILKSRYYPAIKANYMRTMAIHGKRTLAKAVETGKSGVQLDKKGNEIERMGGLETIDPSRLNVYDPGDEPTKGEREYTREMVS